MCHLPINRQNTSLYVPTIAWPRTCMSSPNHVCVLVCFWTVSTTNPKLWAAIAKTWPYWQLLIIFQERCYTCITANCNSNSKIHSRFALDEKTMWQDDGWANYSRPLPASFISPTRCSGCQLRYCAGVLLQRDGGKGHNSQPSKRPNHFWELLLKSIWIDESLAQSSKSGFLKGGLYWRPGVLD